MYTASIALNIQTLACHIDPMLNRVFIDKKNFYRPPDKRNHYLIPDKATPYQIEQNKKFVKKLMFAVAITCICVCYKMFM